MSTENDGIDVGENGTSALEILVNPYRCKICNATFTRQTYLDNHCLRHEGRESYDCNLCVAVFKNESGLRKHIKHHNTEKNFNCPICCKSFIKKTLLDIHLRIHTGERPCECNICGATFKQNSALSCHVNAIHLGNKPYKCKTCDYATTTKRRLLLHSFRHINVKAFKCEKCGTGCTTKSSLNIHKRLHCRPPARRPLESSQRRDALRRKYLDPSSAQKGQPSNEVDDALTTLVDASVNNDQLENQSFSAQTMDKAAIIWTDAWTKQLLELYAEYIKQVGPSKSFKNNKDMWHQIADDINDVHSTAITWQQCETRFKTVKRRKIKEKGFKHTTNEAALGMAYQNEWEQLESQDEVIVPEVLLGNKQYVLIKVPQSSKNAVCSRSSSSPEPAWEPKQKRIKTSAEVLEDGIKRLIDAKERHEKLRSEARERRHQEKLALLREVLSKD